jgi:F-type H+-transporting ATPase subunit delta
MTDVLDAYAAALVEISRAEGSLDEVKHQLLDVADEVERHEALKSALTDELVPAVRRQAIVEELLAGKAHSRTANLVGFVIGAGHAKDLGEIARRMAARVAEYADATFAEVRTATPLSDDQKHRLAEALSAKVGKKIDLRVVVDPSVVGGIVATVGDTVIDGSVRTKLDQLKTLL